MKTVGAYEAKTHLPQLLDEVARGTSITITKRGVPVAVLTPPPGTQTRPDVEAAIDELLRISSRLKLGGLSIRSLIDEGRV